MVDAALDALAAIPGLTEILCAPLYETEPLDCPEGSPKFLNTVVEAHYTGDLLALLDHTQAIEHRLGRTRSGLRNEARVIDIDLLSVEGVALVTERLILPHPRLHERLFVLEPLANLRPDMILPNGAPIAEVIEQLKTSGIPATEQR